ncbi:transcriptional regulator, HxlR family [Thermus arciformis]|uniref:Transcriptional regulator, HxlR family n=1 Tax=Thermus arciformis TaxID=482827 RepID=A0A1G7EGE9_9DEIN|nr:helix-turn-helix domain-containing protein [Thermus arciformis]SDE62515.1 transcriptional regulator, HxlR family [Thermus arciformis]
MALSKSARKVLKVMARRGAPEVLFALGRGPSRFSDLQAALLLSPRTLVERLREFHALGFVERRAFPEVPPRVEYTLTAKGKRVLEFFQDLEEILETREVTR